MERFRVLIDRRNSGLAKRLGSVILSLFLFGCVPSPYFSYYVPSYPDPSATVVRQGCHGGAGPKTKLSFKTVDGIEVTANALREYAQQKVPGQPVNLTMEIPSGKSVRFLSDEVHITADGDKTGHIVKGRITVVAAGATMGLLNHVDMDRDGPVRSSVADQPGFDRYRQLETTAAVRFDVDAHEPLPEILLLELPDVVSGGTQSHIPPIKLHLDHKQSGWRIEYESNTHYQMRKEKYETCVKEKRGGRCENFLEVINEGFIEETPRYRVVGSIIFKERGVLRVSVNIEFHDTKPWYFASDQFVLKDGRGRSLQSKPEKMRVAFNWYDIPLATKVRGVGAFYNNKTFIRILIDAGKKLPSSFSVTLPIMQIDGREFQFEPIEFNYTPVNVVVDPFNC